MAKFLPVLNTSHFVLFVTFLSKNKKIQNTFTCVCDDHQWPVNKVQF